MKKKLTAILAVLFAALFLCGSALPNGWFREDGTDEILRFDDMPYKRPDPAVFRMYEEKVNQTLHNGGGYRIDWVDITHLFEQPFYVISYPVSACCALEIYERDMQTDGAGLESYLCLANTDEIGIVAAAAEAGLQNPITDRRVQEVANFLASQLAA